MIAESEFSSDETLSDDTLLSCCSLIGIISKHPPFLNKNIFHENFHMGYAHLENFIPDVSNVIF